MNDRIVHAFGDTGEVVRYDRAGKWFFESKVNLFDTRRLTLNQAVEKALWLWQHDNGSVNFDRPGGTAFNRKVRSRIG